MNNRIITISRELGSGAGLSAEGQPQSRDFPAMMLAGQCFLRPGLQRIDTCAEMISR